MLGTWGRSSLEGALVDWVVDRRRWAPPLPAPLLDRDQTAAQLERLQADRARLAAYEAELILRLADDTPDIFDPPPDHPAAARGWTTRREPEGVSEFFLHELAMALNCGRGSASIRAARAWTLRENLPATWAALGAGTLDEARAKGLVDVLEHAAPEVAQWVENRVLPEAAELSVGRLKKKALALLLERDAGAVDRNRKENERQADVRVHPAHRDGMATLSADLPTSDAAECFDLVDQLARMLKADGDQRPIGQLRAEVFADLLRRPWDTTRPGVSARLTIFAPLGAASGTSTEPGEVNGLPITAAALRELLARLDALRSDASVHVATVALTDPDGTLRATASGEQLRRLVRRGCPEHPDGDCDCAVLDRPPRTDAYEPTAAQRVWVQTRDRTCRFPNCGQRVGWADLDHVLAHARGGDTDCCNLCCLCRSHHRLKTFARGWRFQMSADGTLRVTTPSGITRTTRPPGLRGTSEPTLDADVAPEPAAPEEDPPPF